MKIWKLVSGILSIILFAVVMFQSCAAGGVNALQESYQLFLVYLWFFNRCLQEWPMH